MTTRLFRAHSPSDVVSAGLVARGLPPGRDVLVICSDKAHAEPSGYLTCLRSLARVHNWHAIVDISGAWINRPPKYEPSVLRRLSRIGEQVRAMDDLRERLVPALGGDPLSRPLPRALDDRLDELYVACITHTDIHALFKLFPRASKNLIPHTFDSHGTSECAEYDALCSPEAIVSLSLAASLLDRLKVLVWGADARPQRFLSIDTTYSFNMPFRWSKAQVSLKHLANRDTMEELYRLLPEDVRGFYDGLAEQSGGSAGLLLLSPDDFYRDLDFAGYVILAKHLAAEGARSILIKPHPRSSADVVQRVMDRLGNELPGVSLVRLDRYYYYPAEIILAPFSLVGCAALISTTIATLHRFYGVPVYCPDAWLLRTFEGQPVQYQIIQDWLHEYAGLYRPVDAGGEIVGSPR